MTTDPPRFDLVHRPWLPVRDLDGHGEELGILGVLGSAHRLAGLSGEVPTQVFALTRLLLAVLHGALRGPGDVEEWRRLWVAETLPTGVVAEYLDGRRDRFDLFHPETPFLQVADLHTAKDETFALDRLVADVPNNEKFFTTRFGEDINLPYAEAARWVVHCQAFDPSGIKSGVVGGRMKNGKGYPIGVAWSGRLGGVLLEGRTLKETLLLNLISSDFSLHKRDPRIDVPFWERPAVTAAEQGLTGRPAGPVDLYVWQSRRIRLVPENGRVIRVLIANGDPLTPQNKHALEPHTGWRRSEAQEKKLKSALVYMPREHDPDRAIWRGLESLLPGTSSRQGKAGAPALAPGIMEWLDFLGNEEVLDGDEIVHVRAIGMMYGSQSAVTTEIVHDSLALRAILASQYTAHLAQVAVSCVRAADGAVRAVGNLAGDLAAAAGGDGSGIRSRTMERLYADLDTPFRDWLRTVRPGVDATRVQIVWHTRVRELVWIVARELLDNVSPVSWQGRQVRGRLFTAAHAEERFWKALRAELSYAFGTKTDAA